MAEPLKNHFGPNIPHTIAEMIRRVHPTFPRDAFIAEVLAGYDALELLPRGRQIAHTLRRHLPEHYPTACEILLQSLGPRLNHTESNGMAPFLYLPHVLLVAEYGLEHFEASMAAQYQLTQRFTAEFSMRAYLERYPEATLARLRQWAHDPDVHVRRLVSESTRPRLPWAPRLRQFMRDPQPVLALLELLKDDSELYVRRSVANNLNDIGKDHPQLLVETARRWLIDAGPDRRWLVEHALRSSIKRGDAAALDALGFRAAAGIYAEPARFFPAQPRIGEAVTISFEVINNSPQPQEVLVDFSIGFIKANGSSSNKVFKLKTLTLPAGGRQTVGKKVSLAEMTTRRHYPGTHQVAALLNGVVVPLGAFELLGA